MKKDELLEKLQELQNTKVWVKLVTSNNEVSFRLCKLKELDGVDFSIRDTLSETINFIKESEKN